MLRCILPASQGRGEEPTDAQRHYAGKPPIAALPVYRTAPDNRDFFKIHGCDGASSAWMALLFGSRETMSKHFYLAEIDMQFGDTRAARLHRKQEAKSKKAITEIRFPKGEGILAADSTNPFASLSMITCAPFWRRQNR